MERFKIEALFNNEWQNFNDAIESITHLPATKEEAIAIFSALPSYIQFIAVIHGINSDKFHDEYVAYNSQIVEFDTSSQVELAEIHNWLLDDGSTNVINLNK
mgnify:CR=1 FL=1